MSLDYFGLEIIAKEFVNLTVLHLSDGSSRYVDQQGVAYKMVPLDDARTSSTQFQFNSNWFYSQVIRDLPLKEALPFILVCIGLVAFSGITSGLNVSLLSIDPLKIKIMENSTRPYDQKKKGMRDCFGLKSNKGSKASALFRPRTFSMKMLMMIVCVLRKIVKRIKPIIKNQHFLLVTLLVANAAAMESLPIFLDQLVASWLAVIISVTFVLIFGEILPQALLANDPVKAGYNFAWLVRLLQIIFFPVTYPLSLLLDKIIKHKHSVVFTHEEMSNLFGIISQDKEARGQFHKDELLFLDGALKLRMLTVERQMVRWKNVKAFPFDLNLNEEGLTKVWECGFSRVPVFKEHAMDIVGICLIKDLILVNPNDAPLLGNYVRRKPVIMSPNTSMIQALSMFREKRTHLALITKDVDIVNECFSSNQSIPNSVVFLGCITLEDIMEQLIQERIEDEYETSIDERQMSIQDYPRPPDGPAPSLKQPGFLPVIKRAKLRVQRKVSKRIGEGKVELIAMTDKHNPKDDRYRLNLLSEEERLIENHPSNDLPQESQHKSGILEEGNTTDSKMRLLDSEK
ncbi:hypothetical protein RFI_18358 [Reticulomyxa filosa]|uniref:CNNM transmembrane domain-containing protein n=1 Tax=Reticulomyxa filosa TaxID=46433 RepID=X6N0R2_RETFI|nr:hypothetical protein RFI_18358 [Reticulomyxa filosa]|eukprot:ETO18887.1 hypothetical protein RFI_18358 [Reticulomyxa filosa]